MHHASNAYAKTAMVTASPRELEASLLLQAAAKLQAVHNSWRESRWVSMTRCCSIAGFGQCFLTR